MACAKSPWLAVVAILYSACTCGCVARHIKQPIEVTVRDASTGNIIPNANVGLKLRPSAEGEPLTAKADDKGKAIFKISRAMSVSYENPVWSASAPGYLAREERAGSDFRRSLEHQITLYPGPAKLVVTVPDDYHGPILIDKRVREKWLQMQKGQREFKYRAELNGYVVVEGSKLMMQWLESGETQFVTESGQPIPASSVRQVLKNSEREILVVGSEQDESQFKQVVFQDSAPGKPVADDPAKLNVLFRKYREECGLE